MRSLGHLAVREAQGPEPSPGELRIALPVGLEGVTAAVVAPAIELDDELVLAPDEVDFEAGDLCVVLRLRESSSFAQPPECSLQLASRPVPRATEARGGLSSVGSRAAQFMGSEGVEDLRLVQGSLELVLRCTNVTGLAP